VGAIQLREGDFAYVLEDDPKHFVFTASRYKFVSKMLAGKNKVLEIGAGEGIFSKIVEQAVETLEITDLRTGFNILSCPKTGYDAVYLIDVFEHIKEENTLLNNLSLCAPVCIIGTPSKESQVYASRLSKEGHVNCKTGDELKVACEKYWKHVFMFGMNDEVLHTGYFPMCNYLFALCCESS
jgi:hypothetical protein